MNGSTTTFQSVVTGINASAMIWNRATNTVALTAGVNTITVWMKKDGQILDRVVVKDTITIPTGSGPAESVRN